MTSRSFRWISGVGVSLSNGCTAIVRTCDGKPPPAKPYFVTQAETASTSARRLQVPDRRSKCGDGIGPLNDEGERTAGAFVTILDALTRPALDPFLNPTTVYTLETG